MNYRPVKIGQRKFLLKAGYTEEEISKMSSSKAKGIIGYIEEERRAKRQKELEEEQKEYDKMYPTEENIYIVIDNLSSEVIYIGFNEGRANNICFETDNSSLYKSNEYTEVDLDEM